MNEKPVYLASDVHIGAVPDDTERAFIRWLEEVGSRGRSLVLNGDLFDYWFEYRSVVPMGYTRVLAALSELTDAGLPVHLLGGNHDWWGGRFLRDEIGLHFYQDPVELELAGHRTLLAHGDGLGAGDYGYKVLKAVLRSGLFNWFYRWMHPDVGSRIARRASKTHGRGGPSDGERYRSRILRSWGVEQLQARPGTDIVVLGHSHIPALEEVEPGRFYLNCGDWVYHRTFAILTAGAPPALLQWADDGDHRPWTGGS
jgi:UDP-2,3-diacylglucosamine hydrolase